MKLAAIDIGSNAVRLMICRVLGTNGEQIKRIEFIRMPIRLGDDVFKDKLISIEKQEALIKTLKSFKLIMDVHQVNDYRACATSAMREAKNGDRLAEKIKKETDLKIDIISGDEESDIILDSVMGLLKGVDTFLNIDVGGGSTEINLVEDKKIITGKSFEIGTVRMMYGETDEKEWDEMEKWVTKISSNVKNLVAVGTGGNINKTFRVLGLDNNDLIGFEKLKNFHSLLSEMTLRERIAKLKLNPDRADVIEPALKIHLMIMRWAGIKKMYAPNAGLKDGIMKELIKRNEVGVHAEEVEIN